MDFLKSAVSTATNFVMNYTETETKVREATNNDAWGASGTLMTEIAQATHNPDEFGQVMDTIYKRLNESGKQWRHVYKGLTLLEYLIKNGSEKCVTYARDHMYDLKALAHYELIDEKGKDVGLNVRNRSHEIVVLLGDTDRIKEARRVAKQSRDKYVGVSAEDRVGKYDSYSSGNGRRSEFDDDDDVFSDDRTQRTNKRYDDFGEAKASAVSASAAATSTRAKSAPSAEAGFPSLGHPPSKAKSDDFADFQGGAAPAPKFQVKMSAAATSAAPAASKASGGFDDFTSFTAPPPATAPAAAGFDAFGGFTAPVPAPAASSGFGAFDAFAAPAPVVASPAPAFNAFGGMAPASNGFAAFGGAPMGARAPASNQMLDPFGDIPAHESAAVPVGPVLVPDSANGKAKVAAAVDDKVKSWGAAGLVDLDNLKKPAGSQAQKQEHKPMKPGMPLNSASTMPPLAGMGGLSPMGFGAPPMAGAGFGAPQMGGAGFGGAGFGAPTGGMAPPMGGAGYGAPYGGMGGMSAAPKTTANGGFGPSTSRPANSNPNGWSF